MEWYWTVCAWVLGINIAVVFISYLRSRTPKNICDMEGAELDAVGWHEEPETFSRETHCGHH